MRNLMRLLTIKMFSIVAHWLSIAANSGPFCMLGYSGGRRRQASNKMLWISALRTWVNMKNHKSPFSCIIFIKQHKVYLTHGSATNF
jgi:hypothetical protein